MADPHHATDAADADAHAYQRGTMTVTEQVSTWNLFMVLAKWGALSIASVLLFITMWFHPGGSFFAGLISALVLFVAGFVFLKSGKAH